MELSQNLHQVYNPSVPLPFNTGLFPPLIPPAVPPYLQVSVWLTFLTTTTKTKGTLLILHGTMRCSRMNTMNVLALLLVTASTIWAARIPEAGLSPHQNIKKPYLDVPYCPNTGSITYNLSVPDRDPFPETSVSLCYDNSLIHIKFTALGEETFYCMPILPLIQKISLCSLLY